MLVGRVAHLRRPEHDFRQLVEALFLFFEQELGVTDNVDEQDVPDLEFYFWRFDRHGISFYLKTPGLTSRFQVKRCPFITAGVSPLEPPNQLSGRFSAGAPREAGQEFMGNCQRLLIVVQHLGKQTGLIKQAVFVHRVLGLRDLILLERFLRLASESKAVTEIGPHIRIIESASNRFLVMLIAWGQFCRS